MPDEEMFMQEWKQLMQSIRVEALVAALGPYDTENKERGSYTWYVEPDHWLRVKIVNDVVFLTESKYEQYYKEDVHSLEFFIKMMRIVYGDAPISFMWKERMLGKDRT